MLKQLIQGMIVGIANIIPGVSGGTMLVAMGSYDELIYSLTHLKSDFKKSLQFLLPILIGAGLAILILARLFEFLLEYYPIPTNLCFCGLIAGSLPGIWKKVEGKKITPVCILCAILFFALVAGMAMMQETEGAQRVLNFSLVNMVILFMVGIIAAATMVIPGVSGSMVLMLIGYYQPILNLINTLIDDLKALNISGILAICGLMIPFGLGVLVGIFAIAKLIEWIFSRWQLPALWAILGLIAASPLAILLNTDWSGFSWWILALGLAAFVIGWFAASRLSSDPE